VQALVVGMIRPRSPKNCATFAAQVWLMKRMKSLPRIPLVVCLP
jgi:hypothetical protein